MLPEDSELQLNLFEDGEETDIASESHVSNFGLPGSVDEQTTGWVLTEIIQIAHNLKDREKAILWLLNHDMEVPIQWNEASYESSDEQWRTEFIYHIFDTISRRTRMIKLLEEVKFDMEIVLPGLSKLKEEENQDRDSVKAFKAQEEETRDAEVLKREYIEQLEAKRLKQFKAYYSCAISNTYRHFETPNSAAYWMLNNDIGMPSWWGDRTVDRKANLNSYLRDKFLHQGKLIIPNEWDEEFEGNVRKTFEKNNSVELKINIRKDIWGQVIRRVINGFKKSGEEDQSSESKSKTKLKAEKKATQKLNVEKWFIDRNLPLPENWGKKYTQWDVQCKYHLYLLLQRGILVLEADGYGRRLQVSKKYNESLSFPEEKSK